MDSTAVLVLWAAFSCFLAVANGLQTAGLSKNGSIPSSMAAGTKQPYRTAYHFQPPKNWMNGKPVKLKYFQ